MADQFKETDLAWAAGFLEGEGTFLINTRLNGRNVVARIAAAQIDKEPLLKLKKLFGGSIHAHNHGDTHRYYTWIWVGGTKFAKNHLPLIIPYMTGTKKRQAAFLAEFATTLGYYERPLPQSEINRRFRAKAKLAKMKIPS